jgi:hypothetical protein
MNLQIMIGLALGVVVAVLFIVIWRIVRVRILKRAISRELLLIRIPHDTETAPGAAKDFKSEINKFEQLLGALTALKDPVVFEVAVPHVGEEIHFYLSVPRRYTATAAKQVQSIWSGAMVETAGDDYNIFNPQGASAGAYVLQKENYAVPIRTYAEIDADTMSPILGGFAKVAEIGEGAAMQVVLRPAPGSVKKSIRRALEALKKGSSLEKLAGGEGWGSALGQAVNPSAGGEEKKERVIDEEAVKALTSKLFKPLFAVNVRLVASAPSSFQAENVLEGIATPFEQFAAPSRNDFKIVKPKNSKDLIYNFVFREFEEDQAMMLTTEEVASMFHLPTQFTETPHVKWLKSKEAPPPSNMPSSGTLLGESAFRGERRPVYITDDDRRRHVYVIGQTGTGKTTLLSGMIVEDIKHGKGAALIDPHGDVVDAVLAQIPKERAEDVIVFDPGDLEKPLGMNMLEYRPDHPEERTFIVNELQSIFNKLFPPETMGPMFEQYMRNALLLLMEDAPNEPATLIEVPRIFTDPEFRARKLARIKNTVVQDFWQKEAMKAGGEGSLANMTPYITSKFNNFISNDYMRPIIAQAKSAFNFREVMDSRKILLVKLAKGKIGELNAGLLGMIITGKILMAALSRGDLPQEARLDFSLFIDEFQNFATDSIATILSEARKYGLCLTAAHQFIAQLKDNIRDAVFGNVGTQIVMRVGVQDAEFLVKQFEPTFTLNDLVNIDNLNAHVRLLIGGQTSKPFTMHINFLPKGNGELAAHLKEYSRLKYGADRAGVEADIHGRLRA